MSVPANEKQLDFLSSLAIDCNFTLAQRRAFMQRVLKYEIESINDLSKWEASKCIQELIKLKESRFHTTTDDSD